MTGTWLKIGLIVAGMAPLAAAAGPASRTVAFPTMGIAYEAPAQATAEVAESTPGTVATYQFVKPSPVAGATIMIERMGNHGKPVDQVAQSIAGQIHGAVDPVPLTIGGEPAVRINADFHADAFTSRATYVVVHGSQTYLFSALSTAQASAIAPTDVLLKTVKFTPIESPTQHLGEFFTSPFEVFGFAINGPSSLRRVDASATDLHFGIYDISGEGQPMKNPLNVDFQHIVIQAPKTFADIRDAYSADLQKQLGSADPFVWKEQPGVPGLNVSQPIKMTTKAPNGEEETVTNRFCILQLAPGDFVQILFTVAQLPDAQTKAYLAASDRMLATIKPDAKPAAAR